MKEFVVNRKHGMKMDTPARNWRDAMPCGNGSLCAAVYGCISPETILFNHEDIWCSNRTPQLPDVSSYLTEVRKMLLNGDYKNASTLYAEKLEELGFDPVLPYFSPAFDLKIRMPQENLFSNYSRRLDFETGLATVSWKDGLKAYERSFFISRVDGVAVLRISSKTSSPIQASFQLCEHNLSDVIREDGVPQKPALLFDTFGENGNIELKVENPNGCCDYGAILRVVTVSGQLRHSKDITWTEQLTSIPMIRKHQFEKRDIIQVQDCNEVIIIIGCYTNQSRTSELRSRVMSLPADYDLLFGRHAEVHRKAFLRMDFELDAANDRECSNELLLLNAYKEHASAELIERMFDYGRYLLFSCAAADSFPPTLQGGWNGDYFPPWNSFFVNNENTQMYYWQALPGNMPETTFACFNYFESFLDDYRENARKLWGCRGIFIPLVTGNETGLLQDKQTHVINYTGVAGWISQLYYDYWLFTRDEAFLTNRAIPFMKEAALFYEDFIVEDEEGYNLFIPSNSPENAPSNSIPEGVDLQRVMNPGIPITINSTIDIAVAKELLTNLCNACDYLHIEKVNVAKWRNLLLKMRPYRINEDGALAEWVYPLHKDNYAHRHLSHLYPVFPGFEITRENDPKLFEASKTALKKRLSIGLQSQTGWSLAHSANVFSRMGDGDKALQCLDILIRTCVGQNLFTYHNDWRDMGATLKLILGNSAPFQVDANMGFTAVILEMLVFSNAETIKVLPALPEQWKRGKADGLLCRTGSTLSIRWDTEKESIDIFLKHPHKTPVFLQLPKHSRIVSCSDNQLFENLKMENNRYKIAFDNTYKVCLKAACKFAEEI